MAIVSLLFLLRAALALAVIPPWQHPDEPQHFDAVRAVALAPRLDSSLRTDPEVEREILESMAAFGWWGHAGKPDPVTIPKLFGEDPDSFAMSIAVPRTYPPVYYAASATLLRGLGFRDLLVQFYAVRLLSVVFGLVTLWAVWAATRRLFGCDEIAAGVLALLVVHPQFVLTATAANPDALVNLLAALIYWQFAAIATGHCVYVAFSTMFVAALLAAFTKPIGAPLLAVAFVAALWLLVVTMRRGGRQLAAGAFVVVLAIAAGFALAWFGWPEVVKLTRGWRLAARAPMEADPLSLTHLWTFTVTLVRSSWLWFGWMAYPAPAAWMTVPWIVTIAAIGGAVLALIRTRDSTMRRGLIVASLFVLIQIGAVGVTIYSRGRLAQGRYLFPAIGPWLALVWVGVLAWWPARWRKAAGAILIAAFCVLDFTGWWLYIVPTYAR